jgi:hypothetical protein
MGGMPSPPIALEGLREESATNDSSIVMVIDEREFFGQSVSVGGVGGVAEELNTVEWKKWLKSSAFSWAELADTESRERMFGRLLLLVSFWCIEKFSGP